MHIVVYINTKPTFRREWFIASITFKTKLKNTGIVWHCIGIIATNHYAVFPTSLTSGQNIDFCILTGSPSL